MRHRSLRFRLAGTLVGFSLLIAILFVGSTALWLSQSLERQFISQYQTLVELFAEQVFFAVIIEQGDAQSSDFRALLENNVFFETFVENDILYAQIVREGVIYGEESKIEEPLVVGTVRVDSTVTRHRTASGINYVDISRGLVGRTDTNPDALVNSYVRIGLSLESYEHAVRGQLLTLIIIGLAIVVVGAIVGWVLFRGLWAPIRRLIQAVQRFGQGDLSAKAPVDREDELGLLAIEFNEMAKRISEKNQELEQLNVELEKSNRAKTEFLTIMSHELRTPLNAILGYAELLTDGKYGDLYKDQQRPLQRMLRAGSHLLSLIENTLSYAKLELGVEKLYLVDVDAVSLINECLEQLQPLAEEKGISIEKNVESVTLTADSMKLRQILLNLIQNAIQNTDQGVVHIASRELQGNVFFEVSDSGHGIAGAELSGLFNAFNRGDRANERSQSGVGLGLTVVDRYTRMHGGEITVESEIDVGTKFIVSLPKSPPSREDEDDRFGESEDSGH